MSPIQIRVKETLAPQFNVYNNSYNEQPMVTSVDTDKMIHGNVLPADAESRRRQEGCRRHDVGRARQ